MAPAEAPVSSPTPPAPAPPVVAALTSASADNAGATAAATFASAMAGAGSRMPAVDNDNDDSSVPDAEPMPQPDTAATDAAPESANPTYPQSFSDIMKMMQEGKKPPGIRQIEDRLSDDSPSVSTMAPKPKPWE